MSIALQSAAKLFEDFFNNIGVAIMPNPCVSISPINILKAARSLPTHWYHTSIHSCPVCGSQKVFKTRMFTPRPAAYMDRHVSVEVYDGCLGE